MVLPPLKWLSRTFGGAQGQRGAATSWSAAPLSIFRAAPIANWQQEAGLPKTAFASNGITALGLIPFHQKCGRAKVPEQLSRLSHARTTASIVPQAGPAPPAPPVSPLARPPAVAEPPRQQAAPAAEEPTVTESNPTLAGSRTTASVEAQKTPSTSPLRQPEPKGSVLYLAVRSE